jgi:hypothetical protein
VAVPATGAFSFHDAPEYRDIKAVQSVDMRKMAAVYGGGATAMFFLALGLQLWGLTTKQWGTLCLGISAMLFLFLAVDLSINYFVRWRGTLMVRLSSASVIGGATAYFWLKVAEKPLPLVYCFVTVSRQEIDGQVPLTISNLNSDPIDNVKLSITGTYEEADGKDYVFDNQEVDVGTAYPLEHRGLSARLHTGGRKRVRYGIYIRTRQKLFTETIELIRSTTRNDIYVGTMQVKYLNKVVLDQPI